MGNENLCDHYRIKKGARSPEIPAVICPVIMTPVLTRSNHNAIYNTSLSFF